jgi:RNA recognition motif. (a.k.a. RRM, RBD, or RNP domain)
MKNLYVGNLPHSSTEAELRNIFEPHGAVEKVNLVADRDTGRSRGFGFIEMTDASAADKQSRHWTELTWAAAVDGQWGQAQIGSAKKRRQALAVEAAVGADDYRGYARQPRW